MNEIIPNLFFLLPLLLFTWTLLQEDRNKGKTVILLLIISKLPAEREQKEEILENLGKSFYRLENQSVELWESNTKGGEEKVLANIEFLDRTRDIAGVASRLWWVENLISKITKLWRARENMTERVKSWRNLTIPPNTKTNIHIHHSIFSSFYSTSLLLALTSYLPWIRRVGEARFHQFPLPGRSGILWIAICTRIVLGSSRGGIQEIGGG